MLEFIGPVEFDEIKYNINRKIVEDRESFDDFSNSNKELIMSIRKEMEIIEWY